MNRQNEHNQTRYSAYLQRLLLAAQQGNEDAIKKLEKITDQHEHYGAPVHNWKWREERKVA